MKRIVRFINTDKQADFRQHRKHAPRRNFKWKRKLVHSPIPLEISQNAALYSFTIDLLLPIIQFQKISSLRNKSVKKSANIETPNTSFLIQTGCSSKERLPAQRSLARSASPPENRESSLVFIEKHRLRDRLPARMHRSVEPCINEDAQQPLPPFATYSQDSIPDSRISYTVGESASSPAPRSIWR